MTSEWPLTSLASSQVRGSSLLIEGRKQGMPSKVVCYNFDEMHAANKGPRYVCGRPLTDGQGG